MRLLDSNIIIYATQPAHQWLAEALRAEPIMVSIISKIEVLGYHRLSLEDKKDLQDFLDSAEVISLSPSIAQRAIVLRQRRKMSLGDSIIAATALEQDCELVTRNTEDFKEIDDLRVWNPFDKA